MKINEIKELEKIEWKLMSLEVEIIKGRIKKRRVNRIWNKNIEKRYRRWNTNIKKTKGLIRFRIEIVKELEQELKKVKFEIELRK